MSAQIIDLCAARRLKEELASLNVVGAKLSMPAENGCQLGLDLSPANGSTFVSGGMAFTMTRWGGCAPDDVGA